MGLRGPKKKVYNKRYWCQNGCGLSIRLFTTPEYTNKYNFVTERGYWCIRCKKLIANFGEREGLKKTAKE